MTLNPLPLAPESLDPDADLIVSAKSKLTVAEWEAVSRHLNGVTAPGTLSGTLGHRIKVRRAELAIKRRVLAEVAGISYPYLCDVENDKRRPSLGVLTRIAQTIKVDLADLTAGL